MSRAQGRSHHMSSTYVCHLPGTRSRGPAATRVAPLAGEAWADEGRSAAPLACQSVLRQVEVEYRDGRVVQEALRLVVVHSSHLAQQPTQTYAAAQEKEAAAVADHVRHVHARWCACLPDAAAASAE